MIKISIGDGKEIEVDEFVRDNRLVPYREGILLARKFLNKEQPCRGQEEDAEVIRLAIEFARVIEGERKYILTQCAPSIRIELYELGRRITNQINNIVG